MLDIIFASLALAFTLSAIICLFISKREGMKFSFLLASAFALAYFITLTVKINYSLISTVEISYIILLIMSSIVFVSLLISYIRKL